MSFREMLNLPREAPTSSQTFVETLKCDGNMSSHGQGTSIEVSAPNSCKKTYQSRRSNLRNAWLVEHLIPKSYFIANQFNKGEKSMNVLDFVRSALVEQSLFIQERKLLTPRFPPQNISSLFFMVTSKRLLYIVTVTHSKWILLLPEVRYC